ncbi:MAG TPA: hypothetical protein VMU90_01945 [Solirubrobacteraceae bacterium]|nr:hypothetical protein [Solirubrobacteraceae bacterium]
MSRGSLFRPAAERSLAVAELVAEFDRLISLPTIRGPFLAGTPTDGAGFMEVDDGRFRRVPPVRHRSRP